MPSNPKASTFLKRLIIQSIKLPLLYLLLGALLVALSYIDDIFPLTKWKHLFKLTDIAGNLFIAFACVTLAYNLLNRGCDWFERKYRDSHPIVTLIISNLHKTLHFLFILAMLSITISIAAPSGAYLHFANNTIKIVIIVAMGWIGIQMLYTIEAGTLQYLVAQTHAEHQRVKTFYTKMRIIRNIVTFIIIVVCTAAILMSFEGFRDLGISLLASAGFITAVIGLSAQKVLFSLFAGLQIALSQPIKIGDVVVIEGESGIVEELTFTYVTLRLGDRRRMMVPINFFVEKPFENWSHEVDSLRSSFLIYADYFMPIEPLRKELDAILEQSPYWDHRASKLQVSNLTDRCVEIRIQVSAKNADDLSDLRAEVREKLLTFIRDSYPDHFPKSRLGSELK